MADPQKLAALEQYADTGTWDGAKARLGASQDEALARQSSLGDLTGAAPQATQATMPTVSNPYGRFLGAVENYQSGYDQSKARMASAQDQYMGQVASAQSAHRAEADQAIADAQSQFMASAAGGGGSGGDLSQWELEALATAQGREYQDAAAADQAQLSDQNASEAELARQLAGFAQMGDEDAQSQRSIDYALDKQGQASEDERFRAQQAWYANNPDDPALNQLAGPQVDEHRRQREQEMQAWVNDWAGSDRLGGSRSQRQEAYLASLNPTQQIVMPSGELDLSQQDNYSRVRERAAGEADAQRQLIEQYVGPEFTREAFVDLNLRPDLGEQGQRLLAGGMFPELTSKDQMDAAEQQREAAYFEQTGFKSPTDQRSWTEAERKNAGLTDPNNRQVRRPDDPDVMRSLGLAPDDVERMRSDPAWEEVVGAAETYIDPPEEAADQAVYSPNALKTKLEGLGYNPDMVRLIVAMYAPSMVG